MSFFMLAPSSLLQAAENQIQVELDRTDGERFADTILGGHVLMFRGYCSSFRMSGVFSLSIASRIHCFPTTSRNGL